MGLFPKPQLFIAGIFGYCVPISDWEYYSSEHGANYDRTPEIIVDPAAEESRRCDKPEGQRTAYKEPDRNHNRPKLSGPLGGMTPRKLSDEESNHSRRGKTIEKVLTQKTGELGLRQEVGCHIGGTGHRASNYRVEVLW
jgi:hypothetical protein